MVATQDNNYFRYTNHNKRTHHDEDDTYKMAPPQYKMAQQQQPPAMMMPRQYRTEMKRINILPTQDIDNNAGTTTTTTMHAAMSGMTMLDDDDHQPSLTALTWTDAETEKMVQQLEFMTEKVCEDKSRFPKADVSRLLRSLQTVIRQTEIRRDDPLLRQISSSLKSLQLVDLDKLAHLLHATQQVEQELVGKDLLLLSGPSGSGKTTTLHFLAGTEFEESEVEGFFHLEPTVVVDPKVARYQTSCCRYGVTQSLQTAKVKVDGKSYYVCDTPGFDILDSIEDDIAHGIGTVRAIQKARTVRPILVFCKDNLGHRFVNLDRMWGMVTRQFVLGPEAGLKPFNYIFTKFEGKHRTRLSQQFAHFKDDLSASSSRDSSRRHSSSHVGRGRGRDRDKKRGHGKRHSSNGGNGGPEQGQRRHLASGHHHQQLKSASFGSIEEEEVFKSFIDDIVKKTTPEANLVLPLQEKPQSLLRRLVRNSYPISDPESFFAPLAAETSLAKLQIQLEMTLHELTLALAQEDYMPALERLEQLRTIAQLLPEAEPYSKLAVQTALQHASMLFHSINELLTRSPAASSNRTEKRDYATAVIRIRALEQLAHAVPEARECTELAHELLWRSLVEAMESHNFAGSSEQIIQVGALLHHFPKARAGIQRGLESKQDKIVQALNAGDCSEATELLLQVAALANAYPEANACLQVGFKAFQQKMTETIERRRLVEANDQMQMLARLSAKIPQAAEFGRHGLRMLLNAIEKKVDDNEYPVTVNLVQSLLKLTDAFPDSNECVHRGIQIIWNIFGLVLEDKHYIRAIGIVQTISGLVKISPKAFEYARMGLEILGDRLLRTIREQNYSVAMQMLLHMTKLECDFPETLKSECVTHGLKLIKQTAEKAIQQKNYEIVMELFRDLMQLDIDVPEAGRCASSMLTMIHEEFDRAIKKQNFDLAIDMLQHFTDLGDALKDVKEFTMNGQETFERVIKEKFQSLEPMHVMHLIDMLLSQDSKLFVAGECARYGLKCVRDRIEEKIDQHDYVSAAEMWQELYELSTKHSKAKKTVQACFLLLRDVLAASLTEQNYKTATIIMQHFGKVERELPEADKCAQQSLSAIKNALLSSIDQQDYGMALDVLQLLLDNSKEFPDAFKCAQSGLQQLQRAVETKLMDKKDYRKALEMMEKSIRLSRELPDALKCAQVGLKIILKATENAIDQGDYGVAVELMNEVHKLTTVLPEAFLCSEIGLKAAVRHLSWLRRAVVSIIDQLGPQVPEEKFGSIISHLKSLLQSILKAESLRYLCMKLHKETSEKEQLEPGDEFSTEQLRRLTELVVSELLNIEIDKGSSTSLIRMRSSLLSTMIRLKVMHEQLYQCPGGDLVTAAYDEAFKDFYVLLDSVLQSSEHRTKPGENLEIFELQAEFLGHVINGFMSSNLDITDAEYAQMEELENRRGRMMSQFEDQITEVKGMLQNYAPIEFRGGKAEPSFSYIQKLDFAKLAMPRKRLLALGKAPTLCGLLPSKPAPSDYLVFVKKFDISLVDLIKRIIFFLEKEFAEVVGAKQTVSDKTIIARMGKALHDDTKKMTVSLALVGRWSTDLESKCRPHTVRLYKLNQAVELQLGTQTGANYFVNPFQCLCGPTP